MNWSSGMCYDWVVDLLSFVLYNQFLFTAINMRKEKKKRQIVFVYFTHDERFFCQTTQQLQNNIEA